MTTTPIFVVSGGAKGITARCTIELAHTTGGLYFLIGRSAYTPDEPAWAQGKTDLAALQGAVLQHLRANGEKPTPNSYVSRPSPYSAHGKLAIHWRVSEQQEPARTISKRILPIKPRSQPS